MKDYLATFIRVKVEEVSGIMRGNVEKILERDGKLTELETRAEQLELDTQQFQVDQSSIGKHM